MWAEKGSPRGAGRGPGISIQSAPECRPVTFWLWDSRPDLCSSLGHNAPFWCDIVPGPQLAGIMGVHISTDERVLEC